MNADDALMGCSLTQNGRDVVDALINVYEAVHEEHGENDFDPECPVCDAVRSVDKLLREGDSRG